MKKSVHPMRDHFATIKRHEQRIKSLEMSRDQMTVFVKSFDLPRGGGRQGDGSVLG